MLGRKDGASLPRLGLADDIQVWTAPSIVGRVCRAAVIVLRWRGVQRLGLAVTTLSVPGRDLTK
jgi:hypothetical protein